MLKPLDIDVYALYCYTGIISAAVIGIILNRASSTKFKETINKDFCFLLKFLILFCAWDALWGFIGTSQINRTAYVISSYGFHTLAALASYFCSDYIISYMGTKSRSRGTLRIIRICLLVIQLVVLYQNIFTDTIFTIDAEGLYHSTPQRFITFYLQFVHYIIAIVYALLCIPEAKKQKTTKKYLTSIIFAAVTLIFGFLQMLYPDGPFYSFGFLIISIVVYSYSITEERESYLSVYVATEEQRKNQKQIQEALERAEAASSAKTVFLSNMSHDIRTPINGIMGMVAIAEKEEMSPKAAECLEKISGASNHLLSLINDVLDMSRIENGKTEISHEPLDLRVLTDNCCSILQGQVTDRDIKLVFSSDTLVHPQVLGDQLHLRQILINILGNAVKFTPIGGTVRFSVEEKSFADGKVNVRFTISDTGIGMKPEFIPHLYDAFAQEENDSRTKYKGTGLGMSIVKQLVDLMGGTITVESQLNEGTTFFVDISLDYDEKAGSAAEEKETVSSVKAEGLKVLLVEDNDLNMEIAQSILEDNGMVVTPAFNGKEAVEAFSLRPVHSFDVILMDVMMPQMNGYDATRAIRALKREDAATVPIIAMTANAFREDKQQALAAGMNSHIAKPINFKELLDEIGRFVR